MEQLFKAIQEIARQNPEGFTVDLTTLKKVTKGISVAYLETQDSFGEDGLRRVLNHALEHERKVGGWLNEEIVEWFGEYAKVVAENFSDRVENFFTDNYDHPIYEEGKLLTDMVYLKRTF